MNAALPAARQDACRHYGEEFRRLRDTLPGRHLPWLANLREQAMQRFMETGFPTLRSEDWKYTSVAPIENGLFTLAARATAAVDASAIAALALPGAHVAVFVDGRHVPGLSRTDALPDGVTVASLAVLLERHPRGLAAQIAHTGDYPSAFAALNAACMTDGVCVHLSRGTRLEAPIHLLFVASSDQLAIHVRNLIIAEPDSGATIVEHHVGTGTASTFTNTVTDIMIGERARIEHHKLQQENPKSCHVAAINTQLAAESRFASTSFALGAVLARADIHVALDGAGAECALDGLYLADGRRHVDHHTRIDHNQPRCTSRELYKGVLDNAGRGVFNGRVVVQPGAQKSDAAQVNRNLLLSELAEIDTKPQLEIWADDVKCSHAATVGQIDAEQIFYLRSRGLDDAAARALLIYAFAAEMVQHVELPSLRERLDGLLRARLAQSLEALP